MSDLERRCAVCLQPQFESQLQGTTFGLLCKTCWQVFQEPEPIVVRIVQPGPAPRAARATISGGQGRPAPSRPVPNAARTAISGGYTGPIALVPPCSAWQMANSGVHHGPVPLTATQVRRRERAGEFGEKALRAIDNANRAVSDRLKQWYTDLAVIWTRDAYRYARDGMPDEEG